MSDIKVTTHPNPRGGYAICAQFEDARMIHVLGESIFYQIAEKIATRYVEENFAEIAARLDQNAIANLAIADAGKKIAEEIRTRPVVILKPSRSSILEDLF